MRRIQTFLPLGWLVAFAPRVASAESYYVPSPLYPTLQLAVAAAAGSADPENTIYIRESPIFTFGSVVLNAAFHCGNKLTIRPEAALQRAMIVAQESSQPIVVLNNCSCVTLQDLDILRNITNANNLVYVDHAVDALIERCRIGSIHPSPGAPNFSNIELHYPTRIVVRNCILFSYAPGDLTRGIYALDFNDDENSLFLYNNTISDYSGRGIRIVGSPLVGPLVLLRNNLLANNPALVVEPIAFRTEVNGNMTVVTSHNAVFATPGFAEELGFAGAQRISSIGTGSFVGLGKIDIDPSFVEQTWNRVPDWNPNPDFYRLVLGGLLHNDAADLGQNVGPASPHPMDIAVTNDIEHQGRPGGPSPGHTDRGADQADPGIATDVVGTQPRVLLAAPQPNPTVRASSIMLSIATAQYVDVSIFDARGRRVRKLFEGSTDAGRHVVGWDGRLDSKRVAAPGVYFYVLRSSQGCEARKITLMP